MTTSTNNNPIIETIFFPYDNSLRKLENAILKNLILSPSSHQVADRISLIGIALIGTVIDQVAATQGALASSSSILRGVQDKTLSRMARKRSIAGFSLPYHLYVRLIIALNPDFISFSLPKGLPLHYRRIDVIRDLLLTDINRRAHDDSFYTCYNKKVWRGYSESPLYPIIGSIDIIQALFYSIVALGSLGRQRSYSTKALHKWIDVCFIGQNKRDVDMYIARKSTKSCMKIRRKLFT